MQITIDTVRIELDTVGNIPSSLQNDYILYVPGNNCVVKSQEKARNDLFLAKCIEFRMYTSLQDSSFIHGVISAVPMLEVE